MPLAYKSNALGDKDAISVKTSEGKVKTSPSEIVEEIAGAWQQIYNKANKADVDNFIKTYGSYIQTAEIKFEKVSHACATSVANARIAAKWSQSLLATKCNEKPQSIIALENGTAIYNGDLINRVEKALGVKINRARTKA